MNQPQYRKSLSLSQEIEGLDREIATLIAERTRLLAKAAGSRKRKRVSVIDAGQEKRLWSVWSNIFAKEGLDKGGLRKLFPIINALAYSQAEHKDDRTRDSLCLYPRRQPLEVDIQGPWDSRQTRIAIALGSRSASAFALQNLQATPSNIELLKALKQAGASVAWDHATCTSKPLNNLDDLSLAGKVIFCGGSLFNFYLLLCQGLSKPGQIKFTGTAATKLFDLRPLQGFLPKLGARLTIIDPHANGLPVRVETAGHLPESVEIPEDIDTSFLLALAASAPLFPKGITLVLASKTSAQSLTATITPVLHQMGITVTRKDREIHIPSCQPKSPATIAIPIDTTLGSYLLALPLFRKGTVCLQGNWVQDTEAARAITALFAAFGITLKQTKEGIVSSCKGCPANITLDVSSHPFLLPLATALSLGSFRKVSITCGEIDRKHAQDFLHFLGINHTLTREGITIDPIPSGLTPPEEIWESPSLAWAIAYVLASFAIPGIHVAQPDQFTALWPDFWTVFTNLPRPQDAMRPQSDTSAKSATSQKVTSHEPTRKRIKITRQ